MSHIDLMRESIELRAERDGMRAALNMALEALDDAERECQALRRQIDARDRQKIDKLYAELAAQP